MAARRWARAMATAALLVGAALVCPAPRALAWTDAWVRAITATVSVDPDATARVRLDMRVEVSRAGPEGKLTLNKLHGAFRYAGMAVRFQRLDIRLELGREEAPVVAGLF